MPLPVADTHPSGSILAVGGELRLLALPPNTRTPATVTVTTAAAIALSAVAATFTSTTPVLIDDNFDIPFAAGAVTTVGYTYVAPIVTTAAAVTAGATTMNVTATAAFTLPAGWRLTFGSVTVTTTTDTLIGTTSTALAIRPAPGAIANTTASVNNAVIQPARAAITTATASTPFLPTLTLAGLQSVSQPSKTSLISIRSFKSGLGNEQRPTMVDFSMQISGWIDQRDLAYKNIVRRAGQRGLEVWAEYYSPDGTFQRGAAFVADVSKEEKQDAVLNYSFLLGFQGIPAQGDF